MHALLLACMHTFPYFSVYVLQVELRDVGLSFFVRYMSNHLDMIWDSVATQPKDSHGMIGESV